MGGSRRVAAAGTLWAVALAALVALAPAAGAAQPRDPRLVWRSLDTPHFTIHFHDPLESLARRVGAIAEQADGSLREILGYQGRSRTHIVLTDDTDFANGSATALPRNIIRLFASAPGDLSPLGDYDDWMELLVTHEHTHILQLDTWGGVASVLNMVFGKVYAPHHNQPRWLLEGLAVVHETEETSGGRLRSTMWDMFMRMDALTPGRFLDIDQISHGADRWPHGNAWYIYGSYFVQYLVDRFGREAIADYIRRYGSQILPYGLNRVFRAATGLTLVELYAEFRDERRAHYDAQRARVEAARLAEGTRLTHHGEVARMPRFAPDGRVFYHRADNRSRPRIQAFDLAAPERQETWARVNGQAGHALGEDGRTLLFTRVDNHRNLYFFHDLFRRDLVTGAEERLTDGLRAREPDLSPDGRRVVFTANRAGTTHLRIADLDDVPGTARTLVASEPLEQIYTPRFRPDGGAVAFARWRHGGYRDIEVYDFDSGELIEITRDRAYDSGPSWSPDGRTLFFSSDRTGIANIYAYHLPSGELRQVTSVLGGAYQPAVSPDGQELVYVGYTSLGFDLFHVHRPDVTTRAARPFTDLRPAPSARRPEVDSRTRPYDPLRTLGPRSYTLDLGPDPFGTALGVTVFGRDLAGFHRWRTRATTGFEHGHVNVALSYDYGRGAARLGLSAFRRVAPRGGLIIAGRSVPWNEEVYGADARLSYRLPSSFYAHTLSASYALWHVGRMRPWRFFWDPNEAPPQLPETGWRADLRLGWSYSDLERYLYDISPSNGRTVAVSVEVADRAVGNPWRAIRMSWSLRQYLPMPWGRHHVMAFRYAGGLSEGDEGRARRFAIGGFQDLPLLDGLIDRITQGGAALRGYAPFSRRGTRFHLAQLEYRFPVARLNRGLWTLPVYLNRVYGSVFADAGEAFDGRFRPEDLRVGVGAELFLDFTVGYVLGYTLRVGYARGFMTGGEHQGYAHLGVPF